ncbi:MAG: hypothetical protein NTX93_02460 [Bacteroidia bacterium]|nr:hypothetical protein [Bacteroidia bacterium]
MNRIVFIWLFLLTISARVSLFSISSNESETFLTSIREQDTLKENQSLYTGKIWTNKYHRIIGDQFLFSNYFLPGTVSTNGKTFKNLLIRYDIYSDEIMIPVNREEILQLNKEIIDSFAINFENKIYKFTKIQEDTLNGLKGYKGYFYVLYKQESALYIKYNKEISPNITEKSDGEFIQTHKIYLVKDKIVHPITTKNDLYKALNADNVQIRNYLKNNKLKVSKKRPESFIPVIRFYDSISQ